MEKLSSLRWVDGKCVVQGLDERTSSSFFLFELSTTSRSTYSRRNASQQCLLASRVAAGSLCRIQCRTPVFLRPACKPPCVRCTQNRAPGSSVPQESSWPSLHASCNSPHTLSSPASLDKSRLSKPTSTASNASLRALLFLSRSTSLRFERYVWLAQSIGQCDASASLGLSRVGGDALLAGAIGRSAGRMQVM